MCVLFYFKQYINGRCDWHLFKNDQQENGTTHHINKHQHSNVLAIVCVNHFSVCLLYIFNNYCDVFTYFQRSTYNK